MHYVVAYDIPADRRRRKIMETLKNYGLRVQHSVFECHLDPQRLNQLRAELRALTNTRTDTKRIVANVPGEGTN